MPIFETLWGGPFQGSNIWSNFDAHSAVKKSDFRHFLWKMLQFACVLELQNCYKSTMVKNAEIGILGVGCVLIVQMYHGEHCLNRRFGSWFCSFASKLPWWKVSKSSSLSANRQKIIRKYHGAIISNRPCGSCTWVASRLFYHFIEKFTRVKMPKIASVGRAMWLNSWKSPGWNAYFCSKNNAWRQKMTMVKIQMFRVFCVYFFPLDHGQVLYRNPI